MIELHFDTKLMDRQLSRIAKMPQAMERALYPAVAETIDFARSDIARRLASGVALAEKYVNRNVKASSPQISGGIVQATVTVRTKQIPLIAYDVRPMQATARKGMRSKNWPGFSYALRKGKRRMSEALARESLPFIASMHNKGKGGHLGIFHRTGRGKIKELYGPRLQYHAAAPEVGEAASRAAEAYFRRALIRAVNRLALGGS